MLFGCQSALGIEGGGGHGPQKSLQEECNPDALRWRCGFSTLIMYVAAPVRYFEISAVASDEHTEKLSDIRQKGRLTHRLVLCICRKTPWKNIQSSS